MQPAPIAPPVGRKIDTLYAWIATLQDGSEAVLAGDVSGTGRRVPLLSSSRTIVEAMAPLARSIQHETRHQPQQIRRITLRAFHASIVVV